MITFKTTSPEQTERFGYELAKSLVVGGFAELLADFLEVRRIKDVAHSHVHDGLRAPRGDIVSVLAT